MNCFAQKPYETVVLVLFIINVISGILFFLVYLMQNVHLIVSIFTKHKKFPEAKKLHKFGYIISGRNEQAVIGYLLDSIFEQDYPRELMKVFVVADNCTDKTAEISRNHGAIVYERFDQKHVGKSYALDYAIQRIFADRDNDDIEAFFIFDADNLLSKNYTRKMNDVFDAGYQVSTSFRDSKNFSSTITSACSSLMFYRECLIVHHSRQRLGLGTFVSGTGYYVDRKILEDLGGWHFNTFTEDIEFSCYCAKNQIQISYNEEAVFYDEQPNKAHTSNKQHFRWCKGTHQCAALYSLPLLGMVFGFGKRSFRSRITCFEMFVHVFPFPIIATSWYLLNILINAIFLWTGLETMDSFLNVVITTSIIEAISLYGMGFIHAIVSMCKYGRKVQARLYKKILATIIFPFYVFLLIPLSFIALFKRNVTWEPIEHNERKSIEAMEE